jgi:two-component system, NtrC family, sensor kinase
MQPFNPEAVRRKILNVDDTEAKRYVTSRTLRNAGFEVVEAATGQECLQTAVTERPDLVVLDVQLPDLHGFEVCHRLKTDPRTSSIPVLHLSASFTRPEDRVRGFEQGADAYMSQPIDPSEFVATIRSLLRMVDAERQLRDSQERFDLAQRKVRLGSWEWNITADEMIWSNSLASLHGIQNAGCFASFEQWLQLVHADDQESVRLAAKAALAGERDYDVEFRSIRPDGKANWIAARGALFRDNDGRPNRMVGISLDVTNRKLAEEALKESQRLLGAGRMAASVAHEINNPLAAVVNIIYLLRNNQSLDQDASRLVEWADRELSRVSYIVGQTLGFYRQSEQPIAVNLRAAVQDVFQLLKNKIEACGIDVYASFQCEGIVNGHFTEIRQIISNLIVNSLEAMPPQGKLFVRVMPSRDWKNHGRPGVRLFVHDNGSGIPVAARDQIFEPFFSTKSDKGTGLGLWVIRSIIEKYRGSIHMHSSVGEKGGTSFCVFLPTASGLEPIAEECWKKIA